MILTCLVFSTKSRFTFLHRYKTYLDSRVWNSRFCWEGANNTRDLRLAPVTFCLTFNLRTLLEVFLGFRALSIMGKCTSLWIRRVWLKEMSVHWTPKWRRFVDEWEWEELVIGHWRFGKVKKDERTIVKLIHFCSLLIPNAWNIVDVKYQHASTELCYSLKF